MIVIAIITFHAAMLIALPLWLLPMSMWWALLIPLTIWVHNTHWGLIHEAVHKLLHPHAATNELLGRVLCVLMGPSFHILRFGHLMHHQYNRAWESEIHDAKAPLWQSRLHYYYKLLGGLYITELVVSLLAALLPTTLVRRGIQNHLHRAFAPAGAAAENVFLRRGKLRDVRIDGGIMLILYGTAVVTFGSDWPFLLLFIYTRALAVSFFDNIYHYGTPADNSQAATELAMPRFISALLLHSNYHETHHTQPSIPWLYLPQHQRTPFEEHFITGARRQFEGPIIPTV